jgi:formylglycine-generating enzyme required for sulfatase activity
MQVISVRVYDQRLIAFLTLCSAIFLSGCLKKKDLSPEGMALIPAGPFIMGSNRVDTQGRSSEFGMAKPLFLDEHPERKLFLPSYYIDLYEATNSQYLRFVEATRSRPPISWPNGRILPGRENYPVTDVNWYEADRYCHWMGKRLPTEAEWEKAARGPHGFEYPWGSQYDSQKANAGDTGRGDLTPVGSFTSGRSPYGTYDMAGNVWEWTQDWYQPYPGNPYQTEAFGQKYKVLRGSSWGGIGHYALPYFYRSAHRFYAAPEQSFSDAGFRCAKDLEGLQFALLSSLKK